MKIRVEHCAGGENEVVLRCESLDDEMLEILALLRRRDRRIVAQKEGIMVFLDVREVLYADAVDGRTYLCTKEDTLRTDMTLAEIEGYYGAQGMLRISKAQAVNLYHVRSLKSMMSARIEISMDNGEKLIVSRHYVPTLKEKLGVKCGKEAAE